MAKPIPPLDAGPFGSVVDATDPNEASPTRLFDARNMYVPDPVRGSAVLARHGFQGITQQLGAGDVRQGQGLWLHRGLDGSTLRLAFGGGRMYAWDGADTYTDITPNPLATGVVIDPVNPVFAVTFNDEVVISDEQNKPWIYTPTTGAAETIKYNTIDEEWNTKGGPTVRSGRVVFIVKRVGDAFLTTEDGDILTTEADEPLLTEALAGMQNTIAWSNALDVRNGYDQDAFDNTWQLTQSSSDRLGALVGDESALVYFRNQGIGVITGEIADDFRTSSTRDAIDTLVGTDAPAAIVQVETSIWFVDLDGRVHRVTPGGGPPEDLWTQMRRVVKLHEGRTSNRDDVVAYARAAYHSGLELVLFTIWDRQTLYAFDAKSGRYVGTWSVGVVNGEGIHVTAMGASVDASNRAIFLLFGTRNTTDTPSDYGTVWRQLFPDAAVAWLDQPDAAVATYRRVIREVEPHWLAHKVALVFRVLSVSVSLVGDAARHVIGLRYTVPASGRSALLTAQSSAVTPGDGEEDSVSSAGWSLGRNAQGSAIRLRLSAEHDDDVQFGVHDLAAEVQVVKARANAK